MKVPPGRARETLNAQYARQVALVQNVIRNVGFLILEALVVGNQYGNATGTPVKTGFARGSWHVTLARAGEAGEGQLDPSGAATLAQEGAKIAAYSLGIPITFANSAEYFIYLEYGRGGSGPISAQAPNGVVRLVIAHFAELVKSVVSKYQQAGFPISVRA